MAEIFIFDANKNIKCNSRIKRICEKAVVIVYLYYKETIPYYCNYLDNITEDVRIHVISSKGEVLDMCRRQIKRQNVTYQIKPNRGRDISALLIAAKEVISEYEYFCFIHDKFSNADHLKEDVKVWIENLWDNMLYSTSYIFQVLEKFSEDKKLGILAPPEPYGDYYNNWYEDSWLSDYELTIELANQLGVNIYISKESKIYVLGTVFWCRKKAMEKLINHAWKYEDFQEEPLPRDGTLSHAVERILQFVAEDAGYKVNTVMTSEYSIKLLKRVQPDMRLMFSKIKDMEHVFNMHQIWIIDEWKQKLMAYAAENERIYIYGAGTYGRAVYKICREQNINVTGFVVSDGKKNCEKDGIKEISKIDVREKDGIIIGVSYEYREEIHKILKSRGIYNYLDAY